MNEERSTPELQLSQEELQHLSRQGDPPFTRRELRMRERAEEAGLLVRVDGELQPSSQRAHPEPSAEASVTTEDVIAGRVPAATGLTRRQLRELAAKQAAAQEAVVDTGELEQTIEAVLIPPERISTRDVADELQRGARPVPESPVEQSARRPVVRPAGAVTGEYTGEFDQIRRAVADINAAPDGPPPAPPARRSIFDVAVPEELNDVPVASEPDERQTDAADVSTLMDMPVVTDDVFTDDLVMEPPAQTNAAPPVADAPQGQESAAAPAFPDWHTISGLPQSPRVDHRPRGSAPDETSGAGRGTGSVLLTILQWIVIVAVAIVLGLLVWYAINRGFGEENPDAAGILSALYYLRM